MLSRRRRPSSRRRLRLDVIIDTARAAVDDALAHAMQAIALFQRTFAHAHAASSRLSPKSTAQPLTIASRQGCA
jgi:hypothetical protein